MTNDAKHFIGTCLLRKQHSLNVDNWFLYKLSNIDHSKMICQCSDFYEPDTIKCYISLLKGCLQFATIINSFIKFVQSLMLAG